MKNRTSSLLAIALVTTVATACALPSPAVSAARDLKQVKYYEIKDREELAKAYPFLKETIADLAQTEKELANDDGSGPKTFIKASKLSYPDIKTSLLVIYYDGSTECGTLGCTTEVYVDQGAGYFPAFGANTHEDIYSGVCSGKLSLFIPVEEGVREWSLQGKKFETGSLYKDLSAIPACGQ